MLSHERWRSLSVSTLLLLAFACAPAASPAARTESSAAPAASSAPTNATLQRLVDGARQEGTLSFVWGAGTLGGTEGLQRLTQGFNKQYGLNVDVRFTPGLNMAEMAPRIVQEYQAGRTAATDMVVG